MEELILVFLACLTLGSSYYLITYPIYTICALVATVSFTWIWWKRKQQELEFKESEKRKLTQVQKLPKLATEYIPFFENTLQKSFNALRKDLEQEEHMEVLEILNSLENIFRQKVLPKKIRLEPKFEMLTSANQLVLDSELVHQRELLRDASESGKGLIEGKIESLERKRKQLEEIQEELVQFYSQGQQILTQVEEIRAKLRGDSEAGELMDSLDEANLIIDEFSKL